MPPQQQVPGQPSLPGLPGAGHPGHDRPAADAGPATAGPAARGRPQAWPARACPARACRARWPASRACRASSPGQPGQPGMPGQQAMPGQQGIAGPAQPPGPARRPGPAVRTAVVARAARPAGARGPCPAAAGRIRAPACTRPAGRPGRVVPRPGPGRARGQRGAAAADDPAPRACRRGQPGMPGLAPVRTSRARTARCPPSSSCPGSSRVPQRGPPAARPTCRRRVPTAGAALQPRGTLSPRARRLPLADAVQAAHAEGFEFGQSVAREAPALWLEAVLARKPRMPSDLEARLLQDSALPIDSLLHDETRHALRRGFWDALERSRR